MFPKIGGKVAVSVVRIVVLLALWGVSISAIGYPGNDDKFITYFVADAIAHGRGIVNLNGEFVEQSSTLLFAAILAAVSVMSGLKAADIGYLTGLSIYLISAAPLILLLRRCNLAAWYAIILLMAPPAMYWALSGMENSTYVLLMLMVALFLDNSRETESFRDLVVLFLLGAMVSLTRPEGVVVAIATSVMFVLLSGVTRGRVYAGAALSIGAAIALGGRLLAGMSLFPLPVYSKTAVPLERAVVDGIDYLRETAMELPVFVVPTLVLGGLVVLLVIGDVLNRRRWFQLGARPVLAPAIAILSVTLAFPVAVGGDWMPMGRFLTLPFILAPLVILILVRRQLRWGTAMLILVASLSGILTIMQFKFGGSPFFVSYAANGQHFSPSWFDSKNPIHSRDIHIIDALLEEIEKDANTSLTVASIQMGMVPYYVLENTQKKVKFFDFRGLTTRDVYKCPVVRDPFKYNPYAVLTELQACHGQPFDLVFDLKRPGRMRAVQDHGCRILREIDLEFQSIRLRDVYRPGAFIADCRPSNKEVDSEHAQ